MPNIKTHQYIVIGSGPSGAIAAKTLVDKGAQVLMLDVGHQDNKYEPLVPALNYEEIRKTVKHQYRFFLGDQMEAVSIKDVKVGAQLSPSRKIMLKDVKELIPILSDNFTPMESLAYGGLGVGWGLGTYTYNEAECEKAKLPYKEMQNSYQYVANHIGISAPDDDFKPWVLGNIQHTQEALHIDNSTEKILQHYKENKSYFEKRQIYMGKSAMAILTQKKGERKASSYSDMDFYTDKEKSAYRPQFTIDELKKKSNFSYVGQQLVLSFEEIDSLVYVHCYHIKTKQRISYKTTKLILATGALGSARLLMQSFPEIKKLPLLCNPYAYIPGIHLSMLGKKLDSQKNSMAQAMMIYDPTGKRDNLVSLAFYTYQSLMLHRLIKESPLDIADNRLLFQYLQSAFVIAGIHHPDRSSSSKYLQLIANDKTVSGNILKAEYKLSAEEKKKINSNEKILLKALRKIGIIPIKRIGANAGSSIHYGGTIPFSEQEIIGRQASNGRIYGTKNVYIADSSGFNFLPAKGVTLSIMANAHRVCAPLNNKNTN